MVLLKIFTALLFTFSSAYYVWQLQLNGYFWKRSIKKLVFCPAFLLSVILSAVQTAVLIFVSDYAVWVGVACSFLLFPFVFSGKKTPLVLTKRVGRWLVVNFVVFSALTLTLDEWVLVSVVLPVTFVADMLLKPVNAAINARYLKNARKKLKSFNCITIVVTGSYGKTSVKNILNTFLATKYDSVCSPSSFNTPLGLARFINEIEKPPQAVVLEAGAKKRGDIAEICRWFRPDHAVICGVAPQHLDTFGSLDNVIAAKGEVLDFLTEKSFCVINADDVNSRRYAGKFNKLSVGIKGEDFSIKNLSVTPDGTRFVVEDKKEKKYEIFTPLLGSINALNISMAFALAVSLDCDPSALVEAAGKISYVPHRLELIKKDGWYILDDGYNANSKGVDGFLEVLSCFSGNKCVVAQGIVEMGKEGRQVNYSFGKKLAKTADFCAVLGENSDALKDGLSDGGMPSDKIFICTSLTDAVNKISGYVGDGGVIAFQNDLPDNMTKRRKK